MQNGNWIPVDKRIISLFAKDRPYTETEAYLSLRIDLDNNQQKGLREYARIWKWSRGKVERFFKQLDYKTGENLSEIEEKRGRDKAVTKARQSRDKAVTPTLIVFNSLNTPKKTKPRQSRDKAVTKAGHNYNTNTNTYKDKLSKNGEFHKLQQWVWDELPHVSKIEKQLTYPECERLIVEYDREIIREVLEAMENYKGVEKKYTSVNKTLRNWIKRRLDDTNGTKDSIEDEIERQWGKRD